MGKVYVTHEVREEVLRSMDEGYSFMSLAEREIGVGADAWVAQAFSLGALPLMKKASL